MVLTALALIPVILSTVRLSQLRMWVRPSLLLMSAYLILFVMNLIFDNRLLRGIRWGFLAAFFALTAAGLCLLPQGFPFRHFSASPHCRQRLSFTWVHMGGALLCDGRFLSGLNPSGERPSPPSE
jgi:hypothetical protein